MPKPIMSQEKFAEIIKRVADASTEMQLGEIMHESPNWPRWGWGQLSEIQNTAFHNAIGNRQDYLDKLILKECDRIDRMAVADLKDYIAAHSKDPDKLKLVVHAKYVLKNYHKHEFLREYYRQVDQKNTSKREKTMGCINIQRQSSL